MNVKPSFIQPPSSREKKVLRLMILIGLLSILFFLYTMLQKRNVSYLPLYILLMITMSYYCFKFLHEWYHYFSISADKKPVANKIYTVDILTTYCAGEPFDMLETTLIAIRNITYPHTAWCCDEADDPDVKKLCARLGVKHVTRVIKKNAKAGNINNALQYATGELCVVLDPDHIPSPQFLDEVVPYFNDQSIGFVQVVQAYYNQNESLVAKGAAQQTYQFYGPMMMAMHTYDTVQAIGANCTFRRSALDSIGGHAAGLAEDMHTAMQLHAGGWRSIYVPAILTRGLVPATMSSYYKQQLKWSRGTWELLVSVYPQLFKKFSWRQKVHYLTLPFHYLSGFIFLINFLIPVISLFTGHIPLQMDVVDFLLAAMPLFMMSILIRHYVQKWVAEEKERGFHMVGGILQIGTWWIHSIGFIYTLIRKKVPYIPTPKNDNDPLPFLLSLPNIIVALISMSAIVYGIWRDYNPYTIFMVMLASLQIFFMLFILSISGHIRDTPFVNNVAQKVRGKTWLIIKTHGILRSYSLPLSLIVIVTFVFSYRQQQQLPGFLPKPLPGLNVFYYGLQNNENRSQDQKAQELLLIAKTRKDIAIISLPVSWSAAGNNVLDTGYLQKIYNLHSIPLLVWKPLQQDSTGAPGKDPQVLRNIVGGRYDEMILSFARQVSSLNRAVYLCFNNNDSAQNTYPLLSPVSCRASEYITAWQYIHRMFDRVGGNKIIWIWKPWNANSASTFFPGLDYVDWLGIDNPGFIQDQFNNNAVSFYFRYKLYHLSPVFKSGLPVMITRLNSSQEDQNKWWKTTWEKVGTDFPEIKSIIISSGQNEIPTNNKALVPVAINDILKDAPRGSLPVSLQPALRIKGEVAKSSHPLPAGIKSILYNKGFLLVSKQAYFKPEYH